MKIIERVLEKRIRERVTLDEMQFGFRPGRGTIDAIFIVRQMQENFLAKKKKLWMTFVGLEKAFDSGQRLCGGHCGLWVLMNGLLVIQTYVM